MNSLLLRLMILAALGELGLSAVGDGAFLSKNCIADIEQATRNISRIDWRPISVFSGRGSAVPLNISVACRH